MESFDALNDCLRAQKQGEFYQKNYQLLDILYNINQKAPLSKSHLDENLPFDLPNKQQALNQLNQLLENSSQEATNHAELIFTLMLKITIRFVENQQDCSPELIQVNLNMFRNLIKCDGVLQKISSGMLRSTIQFTINQLVEQDSLKAKSNQDNLNIGVIPKVNIVDMVQGIKEILLRILDYGKPQRVFNTLVSLINEFIKSDKGSKKIYLSMKCAYSIAKFYTKDLKLGEVIDFFVYTNQFFSLKPPPKPLQELQEPQFWQKQQHSTKMLKLIYSIKRIISDLCKCLQFSEVRQLYKKSKDEFKNKDLHIAPFIQFLINKQKIAEGEDLRSLLGIQ